jgi:hypothetical protein
MIDHAMHDQAAAKIPFLLRGYGGMACVYYGANEDPIKAGFDCLPELPFDINLSRGYPVILARIEAYAGSGYRTFCGWIQIVTSVYRDPDDGGRGRTETFVSGDVAPALDGLPVPFASYGNLPQLFDAPCLNLDSHAELIWTADTFLTTVPMRSRDEEIERLLGFRWGYVETNLPGEKPGLLPLQVTNGQTWNQHLPFLRSQYQYWRFKDA